MASLAAIPLGTSSYQSVTPKTNIWEGKSGVTYLLSPERERQISYLRRTSIPTLGVHSLFINALQVASRLNSRYCGINGGMPDFVIAGMANLA